MSLLPPRQARYGCTMVPGTIMTVLFFMLGTTFLFRWHSIQGETVFVKENRQLCKKRVFFQNVVARRAKL